MGNQINEEAIRGHPTLLPIMSHGRRLGFMTFSARIQYRAVLGAMLSLLCLSVVCGGNAVSTILREPSAIFIILAGGIFVTCLVALAIAITLIVGSLRGGMFVEITAHDHGITIGNRFYPWQHLEDVR